MAPVPRLRGRMAVVDQELAAWVSQHRYLRPAELEVGESSMALLLLWEVEHQQAFPTQGGTERAAVLEGFTRRLKRRLAADPQLSAWLTSGEVQQPLAPGLMESHYTRWSLRLHPPQPSEPSGWYEEFISRWRALLATMLQTPPLATGHGGPVDAVVTAADALGSSSKRRRVEPVRAVAAVSSTSPLRMEGELLATEQAEKLVDPSSTRSSDPKRRPRVFRRQIGNPRSS